MPRSARARARARARAGDPPPVTGARGELARRACELLLLTESPSPLRAADREDDQLQRVRGIIARSSRTFTAATEAPEDTHPLLACLARGDAQNAQN